MRSLVLVLAMTGIAAAQPALTPPVPPPSPGYIAGGAELSADARFIDAALDLEGGYRIAGSPFLLHALAARGSFGGGWMVSAAGTYTVVRGGVEVERCGANGKLCILLGGDVGYQHLHSTDSIALDDRDLVLYGRLGASLHFGNVMLAGTFHLDTGKVYGDADTTKTSGGGFVGTLGYLF